MAGGGEEVPTGVSWGRFSKGRAAPNSLPDQSKFEKNKGDWKHPVGASAKEGKALKMFFNFFKKNHFYKTA